MKVITLTEPWATLVVIGAKTYETRSWQRAPQGRLLVQAAKGMPAWARGALDGMPFTTVLCKALDAWNLPALLAKLDERRGKIIGSVTHDGCYTTESLRDSLANQERAFGDYSDGRFAWQLSRPLAFKTFIPVRGSLGIWTLPADLEQLVTQTSREARGIVRC